MVGHKYMLHQHSSVTLWCQVVTSHDVVTSFCDFIIIMSKRHTIGQDFKRGHFNQKNLEITESMYDLDLWSMTLTTTLVRDFIKVNPCTMFCVHMSNGLAMTVLTNWQMDWRIDGNARLILFPGPLTQEVKIFIPRSTRGGHLFATYSALTGIPHFTIGEGWKVWHFLSTSFMLFHVSALLSHAPHCMNVS